jgi:hypothetical protein
MDAILERRNLELLRDLDTFIVMLSEACTPGELRPYQDQLMAKCRELHTLVNRNLNYLGLGQPQIMKDVLSQTQHATKEIRLLSSRFAIPILRATPADRLCLTTIGWLHRAHPETASYPPAFINGNCAIWPFRRITPIYFFPTIEQHSLLYQPLLFHEFGHFLYRCHEPEMDALVRDLQLAIDDVLMPASQRNDRYSDVMTSQRQEIADTWYAWIQELFCDAVGFSIGGPAFLYVFSHFLGMMDQGNFYRRPKDLKYSSHPVTWLRVGFLSRRVAKAGFSKLSVSVENEWGAVAHLLGVREDYHGFYDESLDQIVTQTIEDMLIEATPRPFSAREAEGGDWSPEKDSLVCLFNWAWQVYSSNPDHYANWEAAKIEELLDHNKADNVIEANPES